MNDSTGREIRVGDLLKSLHFIGARHKRYYQYHLVFKKGNFFRLAHPHLIPTEGLESGSCLLTRDKAGETTIIAGYACEDDELGYEDRPR